MGHQLYITPQHDLHETSHAFVISCPCATHERREEIYRVANGYVGVSLQDLRVAPPLLKSSHLPVINHLTRRPNRLWTQHQSTVTLEIPRPSPRSYIPPALTAPSLACNVSRAIPCQVPARPRAQTPV